MAKVELKDQIETIGKILVSAVGGAQIPLIQLTEIRYVRGPQAIKSEDTFLVGYVIFDKKPGYAEVDVVEDCERYLKGKIASGEFMVPAGVSYAFAGTYENQIRAQKTLMIVIPLALFIIFLILYFQFKSTVTPPRRTGIFRDNFCMGRRIFDDMVLRTGLVLRLQRVRGKYAGTVSGAYYQPERCNMGGIFGSVRDSPPWRSVVMCTYLEQSFRGSPRRIESVDEVRNAVISAGARRIRPCLMTTATTILALIPVLTSIRRGGLVVPVLYSSVKEFKLKVATRAHLADSNSG